MIFYRHSCTLVLYHEQQKDAICHGEIKRLNTVRIAQASAHAKRRVLPAKSRQKMRPSDKCFSSQNLSFLSTEKSMAAGISPENNTTGDSRACRFSYSRVRSNELSVVSMSLAPLCGPLPSVSSTVPSTSSVSGSTKPASAKMRSRIFAL